MYGVEGRVRTFLLLVLNTLCVTQESQLLISDTVDEWDCLGYVIDDASLDVVCAFDINFTSCGIR